MVNLLSKTSVNPATIEVNFGRVAFEEDYAETFVEHAGVETIIVTEVNGEMVATINMDKLNVLTFLLRVINTRLP